jgi:hypothetical protein
LTTLLLLLLLLLLLQVLSFLEMQELLCSAALVSSHWRQASQCKEVWRRWVTVTNMLSNKLLVIQLLRTAAQSASITRKQVPGGIYLLTVLAYTF